MFVGIYDECPFLQNLYSILNKTWLLWNEPMYLLILEIHFIKFPVHQSFRFVTENTEIYNNKQLIF